MCVTLKKREAARVCVCDLEEDHDSSKTENYCRSGPVKFDEKSKIDNPIRNYP